MWVDERGSEVLSVAECRRLLAIGAHEHRHGHLGVPLEGAPLVLPLDYVVHGADVVVRIGDGLVERIRDRLVAFQVDGEEGPDGETVPARPWSVLLRGLASELDPVRFGGSLPEPRVELPGSHVVTIRADRLTGRRLSRPPGRGGAAS